MGRFLRKVASTSVDVIKNQILLLLLTGIPLALFCGRRVSEALEGTTTYNPRLPGMRTHSSLQLADIVEASIWSVALIGSVGASFFLAWIYDRFLKVPPRVVFSSLSVNAARQMNALHTLQGESGHAPSPPASNYAVTQRPNQEVLIRGLNLYLDVMRPFILDTLEQAYGPNLEEHIKASLNPETASNFERDLARNRGLLVETLDVNHFRQIVEHYWDGCYSNKFGHDRTVFGTLSWIASARNQAAHPGTQDIDPDQVTAAFNNIAKVLNMVGAIEVAATLEAMKSQPVAGTPNAGMSFVVSKCANNRCGHFIEYPVTHGGAHSITCASCSAEYTTVTYVVSSVQSNYHRNQHQQIVRYDYSVRGRHVDGREEVLPFWNSEQILLDRGDTITISWDAKGLFACLLNLNIDRTWYFSGGDYTDFRQKSRFLLVAGYLLAIVAGLWWLTTVTQQ